MLMKGRALRRAGGAIGMLLVAPACRDVVTMTPVERTLPPSLSRVATAASGRHLFLLNGDIPGDFDSQVAARGGTVVMSLDSIGVVITAGLSDADASAISGRGSVVPDYEAQWVPTPDATQVSTASLSTPVDAASAKSPLTAAFLPFQWNMFQIRAPAAWAATVANPGTTIRVAILDTGLDPDHLDQRGLIDAANSMAMPDVQSTMGPPEWADDHFHGTLSGAIVTSNNFGVAGVAPNVQLIAVKVLNAAGKGTFGDIIAGILYATDVKAQVINMSLGALVPRSTKAFPVGGPTILSIMNRAVNYAKRHGVLVVSAAGNDALDLQHDGNLVELPCEAGVQLCVSATGNGDTHASYSNYGTDAINVAAPGGDVPPTIATGILGPCSSRSAIPMFAVCKNKVSYLVAVGTSEAAPHVAGLAAYLDSQYGGTLEPSQLLTLIQQNADDIGKPGADPFFGKGRINVVNTIAASHP